MFDLNYSKEIEQTSKFIFNNFKKSGLSKLIIAMSGGIDSSLSAALAVMAVGVENVYIMMLPYGELNSKGVQDAQLVIRFLGIPEQQTEVVDIKPTVDQITISLSALTNIRRGNIMARVRMIYLYDKAKVLNALVCGTENKTEYYLGYFTRFGDEASDLEPIHNLYKTQVWELARYLNLPEKIISKSPSAGLWEGQTDEGELGFSYEQADKILFYTFHEELSPSEIAKKGLKRNVIDQVLLKVKQNDFKHHLPLNIK